jgi:hypothetical protein
VAGAVVGEAGHHLVGRPGGGERGQHVADRGRHLLVRVLDHPPLVVVDVADRQRGAQLATLSRRPLGALQPAGQQVQLGLLCGPRRYADRVADVVWW